MKYLLVYGLGIILFLGIWILVIILYCKVSLLCLIINMKNMFVMVLVIIFLVIILLVVLEEIEVKLGLSKWIINLVLLLGMLLNSNGLVMYMVFIVMIIV